MRKQFLIYVLMLSGVCSLVYGGWQILSSHAQQRQALEVAHEIVSGQYTHPTPVNQGGEKSSASDTTDTPLYQEGDVMGVLSIPRLERELPIVSGTDEDELARGVGHYTGTALPDENDQILLSGHRDTVFRRMGELEIGDQLVVDMGYGTFTYNIVDTEIVDAKDTTVIRSTSPKEVLTVSTCYPFRYVGNAPDRYVIYAERAS